MGVYINGMKMPKEGSWKTVRIYPDGTCAVPNWQGDCTLIKGAKAVPVPSHYDLIDHNALKIAVMDCDAETRIDFLKHVMDCINKAPVVIPSDMPTYEAEEGGA